MKLTNVRSIIKAKEEDKIMIRFLTDSLSEVAIFRTIFTDFVAGVIKLQVVATNSPQNFPLDACFYFSLNGKYLVRLRIEELFKVSSLIESIHILDDTDTVPLFRKIPGPLFVLRKDKSFLMSRTYYLEIVSIFKRMGALYDEANDAFCFLQPTSKIYTYMIEEEAVYESSKGDKIDNASGS